MAETTPPPEHPSEDASGYFRREGVERLEPIRWVQDISEISPREASDIRIREKISWAIIIYYGFLLVCVMALFFLQGFGAVSLSDAAIAALSGILVENTAAGALFLQIIKGVFPN